MDIGGFVAGIVRNLGARLSMVRFAARAAGNFPVRPFSAAGSAIPPCCYVI
jgi:hypothetical protein